MWPKTQKLGAENIIKCKRTREAHSFLKLWNTLTFCKKKLLAIVSYTISAKSQKNTQNLAKSIKSSKNWQKIILAIITQNNERKRHSYIFHVKSKNFNWKLHLPLSVPLEGFKRIKSKINDQHTFIRISACQLKCAM